MNCLKRSKTPAGRVTSRPAKSRGNHHGNCLGSRGKPQLPNSETISQLVRAGLNRLSDLNHERGVTAFVRRDWFSVHEHFAEVIDRAEMQKRAPTIGQLRGFKGRAIPCRAPIVSQVFELCVPRYTCYCFGVTTRTESQLFSDVP